MDILEVLDQIVSLLRQRGRVTYRILKRQFALDDEALEDLKFELITGQRVAVDEDGKVLVAGGDDLNTTLASCELYDPATGTWTETGSLLLPRQQHTATLLPGGSVLVTGGVGYLTSCELYDPATGTWATTAPL